MKSLLARRSLVLLSLFWAGITRAADGSGEILLWPEGAPGSEGKTEEERVRVTGDGEHVVSNVHRPSLAPYLPPADRANGAAVIVIPGGGHRELWMDHEGRNLAAWLRDRGVAAFVLKYRLARETNSTYTIPQHAFADAQRAVRLVRSRAPAWNLDPTRVGVLGFSAGGELASLVSTRNDSGKPDATDPVEREGSRPDFQALIYPGRSGDIQPTKDSPAVFLVCGFKDRKDISEGLAEAYLRFKQTGVPAELHIFAEAGHGFGMRPRTTGPAAEWPARYFDWITALGMTKPR